MLDLLKKCRLCPRNCGVDRSKGQYGFCGAGASVRVGRAALHMWEEPCISGENGSGTVFFFLLHAAVRILPKYPDQSGACGKRNYD